MFNRALHGPPQKADPTKPELPILLAGLKPGPHKRFLWELAEETHVVLEKDLDIVDAVLQHGKAVDADAESEAADFFRVVVNEAVDGGIDHAGAKEFDPRRAFAF
jgi:hypothetical protein